MRYNRHVLPWLSDMRIVVKKTDLLQGVTTLPGSKSEAIRALIFALLSPGSSFIQNLPEGEDVQDALRALEAMGGLIEQGAEGLKMTGVRQPATEIYTGNSGITTRFLLPLLGLRADPQHPVILDCGKQMRARPILPLIEALNNLGMEICTRDYPLEVRGALLGGKTSVSGLSSQFLSALLIALPLAPHDSEISVVNLNERPYVDMTLHWLRRLGVVFKHERESGLDVFHIVGGQRYQALHTVLPGDFSSASYFIAAGLLTPGQVILEGLNVHDTQGDKQFIEIVRKMGGDIKIENGNIIVQGGRALKGIRIDANEIPDLLPTLSVLGTIAEGKTEILNVPQARLKETDRIHSMAEGLRAMGAQIEELPDGMIISHSRLQGTTVKGYGDHRTVMALSLAGMVADGETIIDEAESVNKTYPRFFTEMKRLRANIDMQPDQTIILIGFKHVGKTTLGKSIAESLNIPFVDLDCLVEGQYYQMHQDNLNCRQIVLKHGIDYFRNLESSLLKNAIQENPCVLALGGGTPLNEKIISQATVIHVKAEKNVVFDRIMKSGLPAFFPEDQEPYEAFCKIWEERLPLYEALADVEMESLEEEIS